MAIMKQTVKYYFSVEGETERWYLQWLQRQINESANARRRVSLKIDIEKDPMKYAKRLTITTKTTVFHLCDYESNEEIHVRQFTETIDKMKAATQIGKQIRYEFGYSNLTFDLWMILHKADCVGSLAHRRLYLHPLNRAYDARFETMDDYKHENHFKWCLNQLDLNNVKDAIRRADAIMKRNEDSGYRLLQYKGFHYYQENPSLEIHTVISHILSDCGLL